MISSKIPRRKKRKQRCQRLRFGKYPFFSFLLDPFLLSEVQLLGQAFDPGIDRSQRAWHDQSLENRSDRFRSSVIAFVTQSGYYEIKNRHTQGVG